MVLFTTLILAALASAATIRVRVSPDGGKPAQELSYGIMFEDINRSGDGGIYAELIQNRAFQSDQFTNATLEPWTSVGGAKLTLAKPSLPLSDALQHAIVVSGSRGKDVGISNPGYFGIDVRRQKYTGSFYSKGAYNGKFVASLKSNTSSTVYASTTITSKSRAGRWTKHEFILQPRQDAGPGTVFTLTFKPERDSQILEFNLISLFPPTWKNRPNGFRVDLMETLVELNPGFLRFPGGNNLQGEFPGNQWRWNLTLGDLTERPGRSGNWEYFNTDGIGLMEYMQWCDDLKVVPILVVWSGLWHDGSIVPENELQPYIDDALNELEFLLGDSSTTWGAKRASLGYKKPFKLKYVEIGNEDNAKGGFTSYNTYRYKAFYNAIHEVYPELVIIASTVDIDEPLGNTVLDYHTYTKPDTAAAHFSFFDDLDPAHPFLVGEYASKTTNGQGSQNMPWTWWIGSVAEAIFWLGTEKNPDKIIGTAYAPAFQHHENWQWGPDLVLFNADTSATVRSTSWYVIELLSTNVITKVLPVINSRWYDPAYWIAGINEETDTYVWKGAIYNYTSTQPFIVQFPDVRQGTQATLTVLTAPDPYSVNIIGEENTVKTNITTLQSTARGFEFVLPGLSVAVLSAKAQ